MKTKRFLIGACISLLTILTVLRAADPNTGRKNELAEIMAVFLKPSPDSDAHPDTPGIGYPGWYNPTNQGALKNFVSKYPDTEEAFQAEVWLTFAQASTTRRLEKKRVRSENAKRLERIISKTTQPGTAKMARLRRSIDLFQAEDFIEFEKQADEILAHIKEYESEQDEQFLRYTKVGEMPQSEIEPSLCRMLVVKECHQDNLGNALARAEALKEKFPEWSKREGIDGNIRLLKKGKSPYPKRPNLPPNRNLEQR